MNTASALALAGLVVSAGVVATEIERITSRPDATTNAAGAAEWRVEQAFELVAAMRPVAVMKGQSIVKGDLMPIGCAGAFPTENKTGCVGIAYQTQAAPYTVVETRHGSSSILARIRSVYMAELPEAYDLSSATPAVRTASPSSR